MWGSPSSRTVAVAAAAAVLLGACVLPLAAMVGSSLGGSAATPGAWAALLLDARQRSLLYTTTALGLSAAALATLIGAPLGVALARIDLPWKAAWRVLLAAPMLVPPSSAALAWVSLAGGGGLLDRTFGGDALSRWVYSLPAAAAVLALVFYPVSMLATEVAVRRIEPRLEEAALMVADRRRVLWRITMRLAAPGIVAAALLVFVLAISEFGVPGLLRVRVFTTEVFTAFAALYDFGRATVLAVPLLLLSMAAAAIAAAMFGYRQVTTRRGVAGEAARDDTWRPAGVAAAAMVVILALLAPLALLLSEAAGVRSWAAVVQGSGAAIGNSLLNAAAVATVATGAGFVLGYAGARARSMSAAADLAFVVLFSVPGTIVGVGLIALWNRAGPLGTLYGTDAMLLLAGLARFLPVAALGMAAAVRQVPASHEEAAAIAGARWLRTVGYVVAPQVSTALLAVWVVVFVLAFGELGASLLVSPPGEATLPIRIYTLIANAPPAQVAALALLQAAVILAPLMLLAWAVTGREAR